MTNMPTIKYKMLVVDFKGVTYRVTDLGLKGFRFEKYDDDFGFGYIYDEDLDLEFTSEEKYNIEMLFDL